MSAAAPAQPTKSNEQTPLDLFEPRDIKEFTRTNDRKRVTLALAFATLALAILSQVGPFAESLRWFFSLMYR